MRVNVEDMRRRAEYVGFRLVCCILGSLSVRQTLRWSQRLAWLITRVLPRKLTRYEIARENILRAFPDLDSTRVDAMIFDMWVHLFRLVAEIVQFPRKLTLTNCREVIVFRNRKAAIEALLRGRPVFMLGGHFGNWEASMATFGLFGFPMGVVARALDNPYLQDWFADARQQTGHQLLLKRGGWDGMVDLLEAGGNMGLLGDQDAGKRGVFVDFFGHPASTFKSIALMALEYNALIVVGYGRRLPDNFDEGRWVQFEIGCEEVIDPQQLTSDDEIREITERYTKALERVIQRAPEQYFWVHRRWKTQPRAKRKPAAAKARAA